MELKFLNYGSSFYDSIFIDNISLSKIERILKTPSEYYEKDKLVFLNDLLELVNFIDVFCLQETIFFSDIDWIFDPNRLKQNQNVHSFNFKYEIPSNIFQQINPLSIDDIQKERVYDRWKLIEFKDIYNSTFKNEDLLRQLYKGLLIEELLGIPYYPSSENLIPYINGTPVEFDLRLHNLLIEAYCSLTKSVEIRRHLKTAINGVSQINLPPVLSLILSNISNKNDLIQDLLLWREKFAPFRHKITELRNLINSNINDEKWLSNYNKLKSDIDSFISKFNYIDNGIVLTKTNSTDFLEIVEKIETKDLNYSFLAKQLINIGIEPIKKYLINRSIQPFPEIKKKLFNISNLQNEIKKIWNIEFDNFDIKSFDSQIKQRDDIFSRYNKEDQVSQKYYFDRTNNFRKGFEAIIYSELVDFNFLLEEFNIFRKHDLKKGFINPGLIVDLAILYYYNNRNDSALKLLELGEKSFPQFSQLFAHPFGLVLIKKNQLDEARKYLEKSLNFDPYGALNNELALTYLEQNKFKESIPYLEKAIEIDCNFFEALLNLGLAYYYLNDYYKSLEYLNRAYLINRNSPDINFQLALNYLKIKKIFKAKKHFQISLNFNQQNIPILTEIARLSFKNSFNELGIEALSILIILDEKEEYYTLLGNQLYLINRYIKAINVLSRIPPKFKNNENIYSTLGFSYYELKLYNKSIKNFWEASILCSHQGDYLKYISVINLKINQPDKTIEMFRQIPGNYKIDFLLGENFFAIKKYDEALKYFISAYSNGYRREEDFYNYGVKFDSNNDFKSAIILYNQELNINPDDAQCHSNLAVDYLEFGDLKNALIHGEKSVLLSPNDPINLINLAGIYMANNEKNKAIDILKKILNSQNNFSNEIITNAKKSLEILNK
jgi:tetratricopeptide (TPR) repeat protein